MKKPFFTIAMIMLILAWNAHSATPVGFYVWSDGDHSNRELKYHKLGTEGTVGEAKTLVKRGEFSDIQCAISFDGRFIAFARELESIDCCYDGPGDYHMFGNYDVYVARIDGDLPAEPKKVGKGYWPSWGDDSDQANKTLYYSWVPGKGRDKGQELKIMKATIGPDVSVSTPEEHILLPTSSGDPHMQCAPNGKLVAGRIAGGSVSLYSTETKKTTKVGGGCHPSWGRNSYWLYWARDQIAAVVDGKIEGKTKVPFNYHCGFSQDMKWIIGREGAKGNDQNTPHPISIKSAELSKKGEPVKSTIKHELKLPAGTWCDIHAGEVTPVVRLINKQIPLFNAWQVNETSGSMLISVDIHGQYSLSLYDMKGIRRSVLIEQGPSISTISTEDFSDGSYILQLNSEGKAHSKRIRISK